MFIRTISAKGQLLFTREMMQIMKIRRFDRLQFRLEGDSIIIEKVKRGDLCIFCGERPGYVRLRNLLVCNQCRIELNVRADKRIKKKQT